MWKVTVQKYTIHETLSGIKETLYGDQIVHTIPLNRLKAICEILESIGYKILKFEEVSESEIIIE